ncbi:MAG: thiamine phosphate synthase [Deltaproteobacteria bacterium]
MNGLGPVYPIADADTGDGGAAALALAGRLVDGGAGLIQLRANAFASGALVELVTAVLKTAAGRTRVIVNDRPDVALAAGADGVHLGHEDLPVEAARRLLGPGATIGLSTHSLEEVEAAQDLPVDYLGFGPVFESPTKPGARTPRGIDALAQACSTSRLPVVAIGGMNLDRAPTALAAGAASVAVISEFATAADPAALVGRYLAL